MTDSKSTEAVEVRRRSLLIGAATGGLGAFYWGHPSFTNYNSWTWDESTRRPTAALDGFR